MTIRYWGFAGSFAVGLAIGAAASFTYVVGEFEGNSSATRRSLADRMETFATGHVEEICRSIDSGQQIAGPDHLQALSDGIDYRLVGWTVDQSSKIPVFYWTGANLPKDVPACQSIHIK